MWVICAGISFAFGSLFMKTYRIRAILQYAQAVTKRRKPVSSNCYNHLNSSQNSFCIIGILTISTGRYQFQFQFQFIFTIQIHDKIIDNNTLLGKPKRAQLVNMVIRRLQMIINLKDILRIAKPIPGTFVLNRMHFLR